MAHPPFELEVVTPDGVVLQERVTSLKLPGVEGSFGILARHAPLVAALELGLMERCGEDGSIHKSAIGEGFVEVDRERVRVLTDFDDESEKIDAARAEAAARRARERLERRRDLAVDNLRAEASLRRALMRLKAAGRPSV